MKNITDRKCDERKIYMLERFYPERMEESTYNIDFEKLYATGKRGILFDIDNTLVEHDADADKRAEELFEKLHGMGFKTCFISNNDKERVERFNKNIGAKYVYKAGKPGKRGYLLGIQLMNVTPEETVFIGDQLFTDIYGARRAGIDSIYVKQISPKEKIQIILKRKFEKIVMISYRKHKDKAEKEGRL